MKSALVVVGIVVTALVGTLAYLVVYAGIAYVAVHFIRKFW